MIESADLWSSACASKSTFYEHGKKRSTLESRIDFSSARIPRWEPCTRRDRLTSSSEYRSDPWSSRQSFKRMVLLSDAGVSKAKYDRKGVDWCWSKFRYDCKVAFSTSSHWGSSKLLTTDVM